MEAKYLHMSIEELVEDADFILVIQSKLHLSKWPDWLQSQSVEVQERLKKASVIVSSLSRNIEQQAMDNSKVEQLWSRIEATTSKEGSTSISKKHTRTISMWVYVSSIAAAIALLVLINIGGTNQNITNGSMESMALALPSDSKVSLSSESSIKYNEEAWHTERNINLDGSAYFDVSKGVPFNVITTEGSVHVLGTAFDVVERDNVFLVAVERGLVRVESGLDTMDLGPGMTFLKNPELNDLKELSGAEYTYVDLQNKTWEEAKQLLEYLYNITFEGMESEGSRPFTGRFDSKNLEEALKEVNWTVGMKYEISENVVTLSK
ncbi:MAG: transmembrane sensor [Saprospiraceae bacterium]|jgi:transmembrane sensor